MQSFENMENFTPGTEGVVCLGCDNLGFCLDTMEKATQASVGWFLKGTGRLVVWGRDIKEKKGNQIWSLGHTRAGW